MLLAANNPIKSGLTMLLTANNPIKSGLTFRTETDLSMELNT